jgi:superfamily I DNA/RNA helicase
MITLTDEQQAIVDCRDRVMLVEAPPGTGKSQVGLAMISSFIQSEDGTRDIQCVSFAKADMFQLEKRYMESELYETEVVPRFNTCHSLCYEIIASALRKEKASKFLKRNGHLNIVTGRQQGEIMKSAVTAVIAEPEDSDVHHYAQVIGKLKSGGVRVNAEFAQFNDDTMVYMRYQQRLKQLGALDYGQLLLDAETLLYQPEVWNQHKHDCWIIDESQDLSIQQWKVLGMLLKDAKYIRVLGDTSQAIYTWRSAIGLKLSDKLKQMFGEYTTHTMTLNHRSKPAIVAHAETIFKRDCVSVFDTGGHVEVIDAPFNDPMEHAELVTNRVIQLKEKYALNKIAILVRTRSGMPLIQSHLSMAGIQYKTSAGNYTKLPEVRELVGWVRMSDVNQLFKRPYRNKWGSFMDEHPFLQVYKVPAIQLVKDGNPVLNQRGEPRYLDKPWENMMWKRHKRHVTVDERMNPGIYPDQYHEALRKLRCNIDAVTFMDNAHDILMYVLYEMSPGYKDFHVQRAVSDEDPLIHIQRLLDIARSKPDVGEFIGELKRADKDVRDDNAVEITTIHGAKGRTDWKAVILVLVPLHFADQNEEQRLEYVGLTRPEDEVIITTLNLQFGKKSDRI